MGGARTAGGRLGRRSPGGRGRGRHGSRSGEGFEPRDGARDPAAPLSTAGRSLHDRIVTAIDDDLDMPVALALLREILRTELPADERRWLALDADFVLGLDLHRVWQTAEGDERDGVPQEVSRLVGERSAVRAARDFARSDAIRGELASLGWDVVDEPGGSRAQRRPGG